MMEHGTQDTNGSRNGGRNIRLNVGLTVPQTTAEGAAATAATHTPNTPEILNSLLEVGTDGSRPTSATSNNGPFVFRPSQPSTINSIAADLQSSAQLTTGIPSISVTDMEVKQELYTPPETAPLLEVDPLSYSQPVVVPQQALPPPPQYPYDYVAAGGGPGAGATVVLPPPLLTIQHQQATQPAPLAAPVASTLHIQKPQSIENITKNIIKEGLKMKVKERLTSGASRMTASKRGAGGSGAGVRARTNSAPTVPVATELTTPAAKQPRIKRESEGSTTGSVPPPTPGPSGLSTSTDEERRLRRRERNKIAATKCRNKKKAKTQLLMKEGEHLTEQNKNLKEEISKLEAEKGKLQAILRGHEPTCQNKLPQTTSCYPQQQYSDSGFEMENVIQQQQPLPDPMQQLPLPDFQQQQQLPLKLEAYDHELPYDQQVFYTNETGSQEPGAFLGVRTIGMTYLDLDSRCMQPAL